jgi:hypothetical protein
MGSKLTCALIGDDSNRYATARSLDHEIARQINPAGRDPLVLSVGKVSTSVKLLLSYSAPNTAFPAIVSPAKVYQGLTSTSAAPNAELAQAQALQRSVLDVVRDDLESYRRLDMSAADQRRLSAWADLLRDTERGLPAASCDESAVGVDAAAAAAASESSEPADAFTLGADTMMKLMALSLLCDANRSLVLTFPGNVIFDWDGIEHTHDHDGLAHRTGDFTLGGQCVPGVNAMLAEIDGWYARKFARLVALFDSLPEGDGSVLDNTATMWIQEFSDGSAMNLNNMPLVIAGSAGGYLKQGVAVNVEGAPIGPGNSEASCAGGGSESLPVSNGSTGGNVPINKLYVTLLNALGCQAPGGGEVTSFGTLDGFSADAGITNPGELSVLKA